MPLHPLAVVDHVLEEYESYLLTEFRARDPKLRAALEQALQKPLFLAQEPFFQAHRPFKDGKPWSELPLDPRLAKVMEQRSRSSRAYLHQSDSIDHLLSPSPTPLVVTTGTGSGKSECFLLPVLQNAIDDAVRFKRSGLTAILVYPMNALANDQQQRIQDYLEASNHSYVKVARYDRSTKEQERRALRENPPHVLLTNYMMLEYLLVRPSDRVALFANHRCRFVVLDEVHSYRGALGANIALLFRRLRAHLGEARHDWAAEDRSDPHRFPSLLPVATSATIKSIDEANRSPSEVRQLRDAAVQEFLGKLTGFAPSSFRVLGEELRDLEAPKDARWQEAPVDTDPPDPASAASVKEVLARLAGLPRGTPAETSARSAAILWELGELLARRPMSLTGAAEAIRERVPVRRSADMAAIRREVEAALVAGAALPDSVVGALRLKTHRFVRGGWRFKRCVDPECGKLFAQGQERCDCGKALAALYLCRACGAHALRVKGELADEGGLLSFTDDRSEEAEWFLYDVATLRRVEDDLDELAGREMKSRPVKVGSFDPATGQFGGEGVYPVPVALAPARNHCLACGSSVGGAGNLLTSVALGTSAAVRVLAEGLVESLSEQNQLRPDHDGKERLLIFSDSRQDAAHQARFITYAGRYDRMRRRLVRVLQKGPLTVDEVVKALVVCSVEQKDNPQTGRFTDAEYLPRSAQDRAAAWEEAPLLDDLSVSANYRATAFNLGLVGVRWEKLSRYVGQKGKPLLRSLGLSEPWQLEHLCRCLLDEMRTRRAFSRPMLTYHPDGTSCPEQFRAPADWERPVKRPTGYSCDTSGEPVNWMDAAELPDGVDRLNFWRKPGRGGSPPALARKFTRLLDAFGGIKASPEALLEVIKFLGDGGLVGPVQLHGLRKPTKLLMADADAVQLVLLRPEDRRHCDRCNVRMPWAEIGAPCSNCDGTLRAWASEEVDRSRYVQRIRKESLGALVAREHTAQITGDDRIEVEDEFKAPPGVSRVNVLACSPTLEMGIDVGGLDAIVLRNIPPRPDNYAQRGGRAGRRTRVGIVLGYARNTPHDGYFFDRPAEMIAGEVPAPVLALGNRDVVLRHINAIAFGAAEPGLAGRMEEYVTYQGGLVVPKIDELLNAVRARREHAADLALAAFGPDILAPAGLRDRGDVLTALDEQPARVKDLFERVAFQVLELHKAVEIWFQLGKGSDRRAMGAADLKKRLLGMRDSRRRGTDEEADDRGAGHPMRRFAEFGILPGYEFPSEPATLRLLGDEHEEEPITVQRRFGLAQYVPEAKAHARGHRWEVIGLDTASPWNPRGDEPQWQYVICGDCDLRFGAQQPACPRCSRVVGERKDLPAYEFGGFLAKRADTPVLQEEDRYATASLLRAYPQWNGRLAARFRLPTGWVAELREQEEVRWLNEWKEPSQADATRGAPTLHGRARGFYLCPACGKTLEPAPPEQEPKKGRKRAKKDQQENAFGHAPGCERSSRGPEPLAIAAHTPAATLRLLVILPADVTQDEYGRWGYSLGYALRTGMRQLYMLDGPELELELEPSWKARVVGQEVVRGSLTFIDPAVGGTGFLDRAMRELHLVAARALDHLEHADCESACYRCLKSYTNQRHHHLLRWPMIAPDLEVLSREAPRVMEAPSDDVGPWLEAYQAGVGSPLEKMFLDLFEQHGLQLQKQIPVPDVRGRPISCADFGDGKRKAAIYVDGAVFHRGDRLRRDRTIRAKVREAGWTVLELAADDLRRPEQTVQRVRALVH